MELIHISRSSLDELRSKLEVPQYLLESKANTILHIGVGNFHRSHQAYYLHELLQKNLADWNICGAGLMPQDIKMKKALAEQDYLYTLITQESGKESASIIGSIRDYIHIPTEPDRYSSICTSDKLKIISLTITEKGYCFDNNMDLDTENEGISHDLNQKDEYPVSAIGILTFGLRQRMLNGGLPVTVLSCDNIPENGAVLKKILFQFVECMYDKELLHYLTQSISFPCTMVDRITPMTTETKINYLGSNYGIIDRVPVFSEKYIQWVIEDDFKNGRPEWEKAGATFVDDVKPYELMKIRLLNGGHSALAYLSLLAGYRYVDEAMNDELIRRFVLNYMNELKATLKPIEGINYDEYIDTLINRFANPAVRDRLLRLAEDGSTKFVNAAIAPLLLLLEKGEAVPNISIALGAWIIYLRQSLKNKSFEVKDPIAAKLQKAAEEATENFSAFLSVQNVFPKKIFKYPEFIQKFEKTVLNITQNGVKNFLKKK